MRHGIARTAATFLIATLAVACGEKTPDAASVPAPAPSHPAPGGPAEPSPAPPPAAEAPPVIVEPDETPAQEPGTPGTDAPPVAEAPPQPPAVPEVPAEKPPEPPPAPEAKPPVPEAPPVPPVPPAKQPEKPPTEQTPAARPSPTEGWTDAFVGADACKTCHFAEFRSWKKSAMARAVDVLRPTAADNTALVDAKTRANLDPARDYSADPGCLACHTTGYGREGGFPAATMNCVGCEACHGPGGRYVAHKREGIKKDTNAKFPREELVALGLVVPDAKVCARCHNERSPTAGPLDFAAAVKRIHPTTK